MENGTKKTAVNARIFEFVKAPTETPKGLQRRIVLDAIRQEARPFTLAEVVAYATEHGLTAVGGIEPSCRYHLHHLVLLGIARVVNPETPKVARPAKPVVAEIDFGTDTVADHVTA